MTRGKRNERERTPLEWKSSAGQKRGPSRRPTSWKTFNGPSSPLSCLCSSTPRSVKKGHTKVRRTGTSSTETWQVPEITVAPCQPQTFGKKGRQRLCERTSRGSCSRRSPHPGGTTETRGPSWDVVGRDARFEGRVLTCVNVDAGLGTLEEHNDAAVCVWLVLMSARVPGKAGCVVRVLSPGRQRIATSRPSPERVVRLSGLPGGRVSRCLALSHGVVTKRCVGAGKD